MDENGIAERANAWVLRQDTGALTTQEQAQLDTWLAADSRHLGALVRAQAAWTVLDRAKALAIETAGPARPSGHRWLMIGIAAACLAVVLVPLAFQPKAYASAPGQIETVRMEDGSVAILDSDTRLETTMRTGRREVRVVHGDAWFRVAHDADRPFVVRAGDAEVTAFGTAFSVRRTDAGADVVVSEGAVVAETDADARPVSISAGAAAVIGAGEIKVARISEGEMSRKLAWRSGWMALDGQPLREAVSQMNQYNQAKVVIASPKLGDASMVGWFRLDDPKSFARAVAISLSADAYVSGDTITLRDRQKSRQEN